MMNVTSRNETTRRHSALAIVGAMTMSATASAEDIVYAVEWVIDAPWEDFIDVTDDGVVLTADGRRHVLWHEGEIIYEVTIPDTARPAEDLANNRVFAGSCCDLGEVWTASPDTGFEVLGVGAWEAIVNVRVSASGVHVDGLWPSTCGPYEEEPIFGAGEILELYDTYGDPCDIPSYIHVASDNGDVAGESDVRVVWRASGPVPVDASGPFTGSNAIGDFVGGGHTNGFAYVDGKTVDLDAQPLDIDNDRTILLVPNHLLMQGEEEPRRVVVSGDYEQLNVRRLLDDQRLLGTVNPKGSEEQLLVILTPCSAGPGECELPFVDWIDPDGGSFQDAENWETDEVPGEFDFAAFRQEWTYTVHLDEPAFVGAMFVGQDNVTFDLRGQEMRIDELVRIGFWDATDSQVHLVTSTTPATAVFALEGAPTVVDAVPENAEARLTIGRDVTLNSVFGVWAGEFGRGTVELRDGGTLSGSSLVAGAGGDGAVLVDGGSSLECKAVSVALWEGGVGLVELFGAGTTGVLGPHVDSSVGNRGRGELRLGEGSVMRLLEATGLGCGEHDGSDGTITVAGAGTEIEGHVESSVLGIGHEGRGSVVVEDGAQVTVAELVLGTSFTGDGNLTVRGGATVEQTASEPLQPVRIGEAGRGATSVTGGSRLTMRNAALLGGESGSWGSLDVNGESEVEAFLFNIGHLGLGEMHVSGAGTHVRSTNDFSLPTIDWGLRLGSGLQGYGHATVTDDARMVLSGDVRIGEGRLEIATGAQVRSNRALVMGMKEVVKSPSELDISGDGSLLEVATPSRLGTETPDNFVTVRDGGALVTHDLLIGLFEAEITATGDGSTWTARDVRMQGGTINVDALVTMRSLSVQSGTVNVASPGDLVIGEGPPGPGTPGLTTDELYVGGDAVVIADAATINGGTLGGDGTFAFDVASDGLVSPGNAYCEVATFTIDGDYVQEPEGVLLVETRGVAPEDHDALAVTGNVTLGGTLRILEFDGYVPQGGDELVVVTTSGGVVTGAFDAVDACVDVDVAYETERVVVTFTGTCLEPTCPADFDGNGIVGFPDVLALLTAWGECQGCREDLDRDCIVGFEDLLTLLTAWGPCP